MATRLSRSNREFCVDAKSYETLFASLFISGLRVNGLEIEEGDRAQATSDYIVRTLYEWGGVAYDTELKAWFKYSGTGRQDIYGYFQRYNLLGANGTNLSQVPRERLYIFRANPYENPLAGFVRMKCGLLADFDNAIAQNLDAIKDMSLIVSRNPALSKVIRLADKARRLGRSVAVVTQDANDVTQLQTLSTGAEYKVDRLIADRRAVYEDLLHVVGVRTPIEKGERMITDEVSTQNAETDAYIGITVKTFNACAVEQGAPFTLEPDVTPVIVNSENTTAGV